MAVMVDVRAAMDTVRAALSEIATRVDAIEKVGNFLVFSCDCFLSYLHTP
jgi:hypothetical protein